MYQKIASFSFLEIQKKFKFCRTLGEIVDE